MESRTRQGAEGKPHARATDAEILSRGTACFGKNNMRLIVFAIYLGIGAMLHALFVGPQFDWSSAWTFGWLFGWPIMLLITGGFIIFEVMRSLARTAPRH
jgi:hypothetical protein